MKKVVFITEYGLPPYRKFLFDALLERGYQIQIFSGQEEFSGWSGSKEERLFRLFSTSRFVLYLMNPFRLRGFDVIISSFNLRRPHAWMWIYLLRSSRWVLWGQGIGRNRGFLTNIVRKSVLSLSSGFVVYTESGKKQLLDFGYPKNSISVAVNTLSVPNHTQTSGTKYFLFVGRLQKRKEIDLLLPMLACCGARLRIVGDGVLRSELEQMAKHFKVTDRVEFCGGTLDDEVLRDHFSNAIAYVSPGHVGLGVVHSFAYSVPVVTLKSRDHAPEYEYCNDGNSYLCADEDDLFNVIQNLNPASASHKRKREAAYRTYTTLLSADRMIAAFVEQIEGGN